MFRDICWVGDDNEDDGGGDSDNDGSGGELSIYRVLTLCKPLG